MEAEFVKMCSEGDLEGVRTALQSGVDVNCQDEYGRTGLMGALVFRQTAVASLLLQQEGIDVDISDDNNQTALHHAAYDDQCLATILAKTTSVNQRNNNGWTALHQAVLSNAIVVLRYLAKMPQKGRARYQTTYHTSLPQYPSPF